MDRGARKKVNSRNPKFLPEGLLPPPPPKNVLVNGQIAKIVYI